MTVKDLTQRAKELMPWNWGKRPVRVHDQRRESKLPARREDVRSLFEDMFEDFFGRRFGDRWLAPLAGTTDLLGTDWPRVDLEETDDAFVKAATKAGLISLKGHRLVGGMRASIYNAMSYEGVEALVQYMQQFEQAHPEATA